MTAVGVAETLWLLVAAGGLNVALGYGGLPLLGHGAFVGIGSYGVLLLAAHTPLPLGLCIAGAVLAATAAGSLVAVGAARLHGAALALATWALAWLVYAGLLAFPDTFGGAQGLVYDTPARFVSPTLGVTLTLTPQAHVAVAGGLAAVLLWLTARAGRGPSGLDLAALREGPDVATSLGVPVAAVRRRALAVSAALGGLAGAGTVLLLGVVAPADVSPLLSIELFAAVLIGGTAAWWGPLLGVGVLTLLPAAADALAHLLDVDAERARGLATAALLVGALVLRDRVARALRRLLPDRQPTRARPGAAPPLPVTGARTPAVALVARGLVFGYGGMPVLDGVDLDVRGGEVHALVGPNGSGKTTCLRLLAGALPMQAGTVALDGADITRLQEPVRVARGVVRTFQRTVLLPGQTVSRQVALGTRVDERRVGRLRAALRTPTWRGAHHEARGVIGRVLGEFGLHDRAHARPGELVYGEQRMLQIARAVATGARVLLLDEPAAGMSRAERAELTAVLRRLAGNGLAVLLVEHDMRLVADVADRLTVLAAGRVLATGDPDTVRADPEVGRAYLGAVADLVSA